jgi:thioredoxin reductase (NADPH)
MSRYLVERIATNPRITVRGEATVSRLDGDHTLGAVHVATSNGEVEIPCVALFSFIGAEPESEWLSGCAALDRHGFVLTDRSLDAQTSGDRWRQLGRAPLSYETSCPGMFAVGDVRSGSTKRVAAAVGEGSAAVGSVHEYLAFTS